MPKESISKISVVPQEYKTFRYRSVCCNFKELVALINAEIYFYDKHTVNIYKRKQEFIRMNNAEIISLILDREVFCKRMERLSEEELAFIKRVCYGISVSTIRYNERNNVNKNLTLNNLLSKLTKKNYIEQLIMEG